MKKWLAAAIILFSTVAMAQSAEKLEAGRKAKLDTFFSNFSEAGVQSFKKGALSDEALLEFALRHNYLNNFKSLGKSKDGLSAIVPASLVDKATVKYFGLKMKNTRKEGYAVPLADGEAYTFSQIGALVNMGNGLYRAEGVIYSTGSGGTPDPHGTPEQWKKKGEEVDQTGTFSAVIKSEADRYILLEYTVQ